MKPRVTTGPARESALSAADLSVALYRAGLAVARGLERALAPVGLPPLACSVVLALHSDGSLTVTDLANAACVDRHVADNLISRLVGEGLAARVRSTRDGRLHVSCVLTERGQKVRHEIDRRVMPLDDMLRGVISFESEATLVGLAGALSDTLNAATAPLPRRRKI